MDVKEIKRHFRNELGITLDGCLGGYGFKRKASSTAYKRQKGTAQQTFDMAISLHPAYERNAIIHIYPRLLLELRDVNEIALKLVNGNAILLANAPDITLNRPLEHFVPLEHRTQWYAYELSGCKAAISSAYEQFNEWGLPFLDDYVDEKSILNGYLAADQRPVLQKNWYLFVVAAAVLLDKKREALEIAEKEFATKRDRSKYEAVFANLAK